MGLVEFFERIALARLLACRRLGVVLSEHTADDGAKIFQQACCMGLEGIVTKRLSVPFGAGTGSSQETG